MRFYYDLHMHTALSPCGDADMTPNNIVNMSILKGLDIIAVSDHNTAGNIKSVMQVAEGTDLLVIPGMEIESSEEVHILCLFPNLEAAMQASETVHAHLNPILNRPEIFGEQTLLDAQDEPVGIEENLLVTATSLSIAEVKKLADGLGGVAIPAHVDRNSYSVLSNLGVLPDIGFETIEVSKKGNPNNFAYLRKKMIQNSDAHYLEDISEPECVVDLPEKSAACLLNWLKNA